MTFDIGPFRLYRTEEDSSLCVSLIALDDYPLGFEYGWADPMRGVVKPWINFRIGKLQIFYFETWKWGLEIWVFGFWIILAK